MVTVQPYRLIVALLLMGASLCPAAAEEPLAIVVPATVHRLSLSRDDLTAIYRRKRRYWEGQTQIEPVNLPAVDPRRRTFSHLVLGRYPEEMEDYWNDQYFHGITPPYVVDSVEAVLRFVEKTSGAIGYVPLCSVDRRVTIILVIKPDGGPGTAADVAACKK